MRSCCRLAVGKSPSGGAIADFNEDSIPDLAVANRGSNRVTRLSERRARGSSGGNVRRSEARPRDPPGRQGRRAPRGCTVGRVTRKYSSVRKGRVIAQRPKAGTRLPAGRAWPRAEPGPAPVAFALPVAFIVDPQDRGVRRAAHDAGRRAVRTPRRRDARQDPAPQMMVGRIEGRFLATLVALSGARRILEFGTFTGYSSISMASALPPDGKVITLDVDPEATAIARRYMDESGHGDKIEIRLGPALETLEDVAGPVRPRLHRRRQAELRQLLRGGAAAARRRRAADRRQRALVRARRRGRRRRVDRWRSRSSTSTCGQTIASSP